MNCSIEGCPNLPAVEVGGEREAVCLRCNGSDRVWDNGDMTHCHGDGITPALQGKHVAPVSGDLMERKASDPCPECGVRNVHSSQCSKLDDPMCLCGHSIFAHVESENCRFCNECKCLDYHTEPQVGVELPYSEQDYGQQARACQHLSFTKSDQPANDTCDGCGEMRREIALGNTAQARVDVECDPVVFDALCKKARQYCTRDISGAGWTDSHYLFVIIAMAGFAQSELQSLRQERDRLARILDFFGIELTSEGDPKFKPSTMDKWRKIQNDREVEELKGVLLLHGEKKNVEHP